MTDLSMRVKFYIIPLLVLASLFYCCQLSFAQTAKFELDDFDSFIKNLDRGVFKTEDTEFLFRLFKQGFSEKILSTLDNDLNTFVEDTLKDSGYLKSAAIFLTQLGTVVSNEHQKKIDEYVENQLSRFQEKYRYDEKLSGLVRDQKILDTLKDQFKSQLRKRYETIKDSFRSELKRNFPYAADMVVKTHDSLNADIELKTIDEMKKIKFLAPTGDLAAAGVAIIVLRKAMTKLILKVVGKKIAASLVGKVLQRWIPFLGWLLTVYDLATAERQLLTVFREEYTNQFQSPDFQKKMFEESIGLFEDEAKPAYKNAVDAFLNSISIKEANRLTGLIIQSKSPDAEKYFPNYDTNDRAKTVVDTVVRVYGSDPVWSNFQISEKFEIAQSIGVENENVFVGLLKSHKEKFYKICEQKVNSIRDLLTIGEESMVRYCLEFSEPLPVLEKLAYLQEKMGSDLKGKLEFVKFLIDYKAIEQLQKFNIQKEALLPLSENFRSIQEVYKTNQKAGSFMFEVAAKDKEMFKVCMAILDKHQVPAIQEKIIRGITDLGLPKTKIILSKISPESLVSFFDLENYNAKVDKYGERIVIEFNSGGNRGIQGFEKVWEINGGGYSDQFEADWKAARDLLKNVDIEPNQISKGSLDLYKSALWSYDIPILGPIIRIVVTYLIKGNNLIAAGIILLILVFGGLILFKFIWWLFPSRPSVPVSQPQPVQTIPVENEKVEKEKKEPQAPAVVIVPKVELPIDKKIQIRSEGEKNDNHDN